MKRVISISGNFLIAFALLSVIFFSSCSKDDNNTPSHPDVAGFMAFNLSPDQALIGIALSGNRLNVPLTYTSYTGGYVAIYPGKRSTTAYNATNGNTFASRIFTYEPNKYYSLFVTGANGTYKNIIVNDGLDSLKAAAGKAFVRYVNAIPDSAAPMITISNNGMEVVNEDAAFTTVSPFVSIDSGNVNIKIGNDSAISANRTISLEASNAYTVLFLGDPSGSDAEDSIQIRYIINGKVMQDSTNQNLSDTTD